jgi:AraC-like DNA-binding protein
LNSAGNLFLVVLINGAIAQGLFVVLLLNHKSVRKSRANLFLSILMVAMAFSIAHILYAEKIIAHISRNVYSLGDPTFLLIAPLLWFYASELTGQRVSFSGRLLLHFLPFFLIVLFSLTFSTIQSEAFAVYIQQNQRLLNVLFWIIVVVQFSGYLYVIQKMLNTHQKLIQQEVSNTENVNISWVRFFLIVFLVINLYFLFSLFAVIHLHNDGWLQKTTAALFSISVFALSFKGILQQEVFNTLFEKTPASNNSTVVTEPNPVLIEKVVQYMIQKKPYLDAELTLSGLAKDLLMSRSQLSQLINDGIGENFYDFVNKYRVEEVKRLMTDPQANNYSLLGIALEAGFKSKSTFNLIFKRFTGLTPSQYKKNLLA